MRILVILTGGTITMVRNPETGALRPADTETFRAFVPELFASDIQVDMFPFCPLVDSSDVNPDDWSRMARTVYENYDKYDGFVVLHGTDTMSYSASAVSFMLQGLSKPVVFTGSQLPVGVLRSDAKENLLTAIEIASAQDESGRSMVPEVSLCFEGKVFRANRTTKRNAEHFSAFNSYNYPALAKAGDTQALARSMAKLVFSEKIYERVGDTFVKLNSGLTSEELDRFIALASAKVGESVAENAAKIICPALVIGSEGDVITGGEAAKELAKAIDGAELYIYGKEYGHAVYDEAPDYKERLLEFFK